ncbi:hypothetical protein FB45DRAFT_931895 [Roridomyces roridus]|uniref:Uncharacterized protein n=1 Tax=Roridomyces roridus TaxID=1738132 RepID=A0AAD7BEU5_9AGAR|nr:hypothetical protein FB45DRAFT_931895 [Roridomyces roridus]
MSLQTSTATSAQQHPVYPVFTPDGHYAPYAAPEQLNASATTSPSAVPLPFASLPRPLVVQASSPTPSISGAPSSPTISRPGTAPSTPIVTASSLQVVRHANPTTPSRPTSQLDRQMHTKYLETRGERLSEALATAESERQRLSDEKEQMMLFGRRLAYDHQMAKARNTELVLTESRVQVPIPKAEPLDLEPKSEPKTEADEKPPSLSDSKFYTWDPPDPDRKRPRAKYEEEDDVKVEAGVERAAQRPRYEQEDSKLLISVKAENVKAEEGEESDSSAISMGPAFPIPRELNFDVKTQTSPVHYFMEIRRKTEGG